jgi:hypothetical protein
MTRVIVTAVLPRAPFVEYLQRHIDGLEVVWDKHRDAMDTFLRATAQAGDDPVIRLEDDICLTKNWRDKIEAAIAERPNDVIQFFSRSKYDPIRGSRYKAGNTFAYNVCNYIPAGMSPKFIEHLNVWEDKEKHPTGYDLLMGDYLSKNHINYWLQVPSLVNHAVTISQIDRRRARSRQSTTFIEPELAGYPQEVPQ